MSSTFLIFVLAFSSYSFGDPSVHSGELLAQPSTRLAGDHPSGKLHKQTADWTDGLLELVNRDERFRGYWINANDTFFYRGEVTKLNEMLAQYAGLTETPLSVVLHTGTTPLCGPIGDTAKEPYDWRMDIVRRGWGAPLDPEDAKDKPGYVVTIHVWVDQAITLDQLTIPKTIQASSGGEIEKFIENRKE